MGRANAAYYASRDPFADFVTAPEISQIFGELLGAWCAVVMQNLGEEVRLVEAGPGRGTLMADMLRVLSRITPDRMPGLSVHLIETSRRLRDVQCKALDGKNVPVSWHDTLADVPPGPMVLVANEFLDALPIRQFVRAETRWQERFVQEGLTQPRQWVLCECDDVPPDVAVRHVTVGDVVETSPASTAFIRQVAQRFEQAPGVALFIDYGTSVSCTGESLQALRDGRPVSALAEPGTADLTAHVDFAAMARAATAAGGVCYGPVEQGALLRGLGALQRAEALCAAAPEQAGTIRAGLDRLIGPDRMGRLFKALAVTSPKIGGLPGFPEQAWGDT
nr:SAM-dependent methyltransferase [Acetobacter conturbans]